MGLRASWEDLRARWEAPGGAFIVCGGTIGHRPLRDRCPKTRERDRQRETERERDRERDKQRQRRKETDTETERQRQKEQQFVLLRPRSDK